MFLRSLRRPYITCESELELYNDCKNRMCAVEKDLKLNYKKIKEQNRHFILRDNLEFTFEIQHSQWKFDGIGTLSDGKEVTYLTYHFTDEEIETMLDDILGGE